MPKSVRVGYCTFDVAAQDVGSAMASLEFGHTNIVSSEIRISPGLDAIQVANTFLHECLHAIHWVYGVSDQSDEEEFTNQTANGLCAFIQDNPEAWAWLTSILGSR